MRPQAAELIRVPAASLQPGMFVAQADRPWLETPFALQGFYVRDRDDIEYVAKHCAYVYVDPGAPAPRATAHSARRATPTAQRHRDKVSLKQEFDVAKAELESSAGAMKKVFEQLRRNRHLNVGAMRQAIDPLVDSVLRNGEAMAALVRMKAKGDYLFNHSLANAVWAAVLGRHLALDVPTLKQLALGASLVDVGMVQVEDEILRSAKPLTAEQVQRVRQHVALGVKMLKDSSELSAEVVEIVEHHHERHDGSGYPRGFAGDDIPLLGRIAGLVDSYDAMITDRPWAVSRSSFEAMKELSDTSNMSFQAELVEQFMQVVGLFPTGTIVELNTGEVGVVVMQNASRRLRPKVVVVLNREHARYDDFIVVDLASYSRDHGAPDLWISKELKPGSYGIRPEEFFL